MSIELEQYRSQQPSGPDGPQRAIKIAVGVAIGLALFGFAYLGVRWLASAVNDIIADTADSTVVAGLPVTLEIAPGESASQIARELADAGVVASAADFDRAVRDRQATDRLQAGSFDLETGMTPDDVIDVLIEGPATEVFRLTVIEGLTVVQTLESIAGQTEHEFEALAAALLDGTVTSSLLEEEADELVDWEGLLFPDTYEFTTEATPEQILTRLAGTAESRVASIDWSAIETLGFTPYDGIIVASMIEREARLDEERPIIASVIYNRLALDMLLQIDATVVYAIGGAPPDGGLTFADLEVDSPYNTYLESGLPPTPIAGSRMASLRAAADPATTDFIYYVLTDTDGSHSFTADFDEFLEFQDQARAEGVIP